MRKATCYLGIVTVFCMLASGGGSAGQTKEAEPAGKQTAKPNDAAKVQPRTHRVEKAPLKIEVTLKGVFEAEQMTEVSLAPEEWSALSVKKAVEHGAAVSRGDTLVWLDTQKIDQAIRDLQTDLYIGDLAIKLAEEELQNLEKSLPVDMAAAERAKRLADEDLQNFLTVERPLAERIAHHSVKSNRNYLEYEKEELRQLEKMYKADDLTEETEEIIIKRQRDSVENYTFQLENAETRRDQTLKVNLPRQEQTAQENVRKQTLAWEKAQATLPLAVQQRRTSLDKQKSERGKSAEKLSKLMKDRQLMDVRAATDGIVYYGKCVRGNWTTMATVAAKLQPGGTLSSDEVFMTIVQQQPVAVRAVVEEKDLSQVQPGTTGKIVAVAYPDAKMTANVEAVSQVPVTPGNFDARISVRSLEGKAPMPGMTCTVKVVAYENKDAVAIPASAVFADELDEEKQFVYVVAKEGSHEKRPVKVGKKAASKVEIVEGLAEGDQILLEKP
jgi:multidrug resistance efflux pump